MAKNKLDMTKVVARWKKAKEQLPKLLTSVSKNTFVDSWKKQGWDGEKWKEVKRRTPGTRAYNSATKAARTRAILVQSSALSKSIVINSQTFARMVISTNVPYAQIHNEGFRGVVYVKPHKRQNTIKSKVKGSFQGTAVKQSSKTIVLTGSRVNVKGYSYRTNIPQRKFMGHGSEVEKKQRDIIGVALANVFMPGKFKYKMK